MVDKVGGVEFDINVNSSQANAALARFGEQAQKLTAKMKPLDSGTVSLKNHLSDVKKRADLAAKASSNLSRSVGMGAVQFGQFAGQVQGGQSALLAFSQQGADIGMLFGPTGMIAGGIIAVGAALAGTLMPGLMDSTDATEKLSDKLKELRKTNRLSAEQVAFLNQVEEDARKTAKEKIKDLSETIKEKELSIIKDKEMIKTGHQLLKLRKGESVSGKKSAAAARIKEEEKALIQLRAARATLNQDMEASEDPSKVIMEESSARIAALKTASEIENKLIREKNEEGYRIRLDGMSMAESAQVSAWEKEKIRLKAASEARIAMMKSETQKAQENKILSEEQKLQIANDYAMLVLDQKNQLNEKLRQSEEAHTSKMIKIKEMEESAKRKEVAGAFGNMSQLMNTESRKLFEIGKAAALASAVVSGYDAAVTNYKKGSDIGGPPVGAAFAAASLAATFAQVRAIQSTSFGGSGSGQSIQGGQVSNNVNGGGVGPQQNNQDISISVTGGDDAGRSILNLVNMTIANGGKIGGG